MWSGSSVGWSGSQTATSCRRRDDVNSVAGERKENLHCFFSQNDRDYKVKRRNVLWVKTTASPSLFKNLSRVSPFLFSLKAGPESERFRLEIL